MSKRKLTFGLALILILSILAIAIGAQYKPYAFPVIGKWQPSRNPLLIDEYGFQDIQNMRRDGNRLKGVSGHSKLNITKPWNTDKIYPKNGFHFRKHQPAESHVIITAASTNDTHRALFDYTVAIPGRGDFATTAEILITEDTSAGLGRFSNAPQGNVIYTNGQESLIWGGDELVVAGFNVYNPDGSFSYNYYDEVSNNLTSAGNIATMTPSAATADTDTKLLIHMDGADAGTNFSDSSAENHTDTAAGNAQNDTEYKKFGTAAGLFDGAGDYVTYPDHADWNFGSDKFTVDLWVRRNGGVGNETLFSQTDTGGAHYEINYNVGSTQLYFGFYDSASYTISILSNSVTLADDTWYHIAIVRGWNGNIDDWALTVNGAPVATDTDNSVISDMDGTFQIAARNAATVFTGYIDELRVSKGVARWTSNFEPPTSAYSGTGKVSMHLGSPRPLQGFKAYIGTPNTAASEMKVSYWDGSGWSDVSSLVDNTDTGASLAVTGTVTFDSTVGSARPSIINGLQLYWYKIGLSACDSTATITQVTLDAPFQDMTNLWSATYLELASAFVYEDSTYKDYTDELQDDTPSYFAVLDALDPAESLLLGFTEAQQGFNVRIVAGEENDNASVLTVSYWSGAAWTAVSGVTDGTVNGVKSLAKSGVISFTPVSAGSEFEREIEQEEPLYWYRLRWSNALAASVDMYHVQGIVAPEAITGYTFSAMFQGRTFLFGEDSKAKNKALYSAYNTPFVFNGSDSGILYFGDESAVTATATIYNVFQTSGLDQMMVFKANEVWRMFGDGPGNWLIQQVASNIGAIAPLSVAVCEATDVNQLKRQVVIWQSAHGVYMSDGSAPVRISDDIANYWDHLSSDYIPVARMDDSVGWYNPNLQSYKLLISSGSGQATHNVELEYSLKYQQWTKLYRETSQETAEPLQIGFPVIDTVGNVFTYGAMNDGWMRRLEYGNYWHGIEGVDWPTPIQQHIWTKDMMLDADAPFLRSTVIKYFRMAYNTKSAMGTSEVTVEHYCDGTATTDGASNQKEPADIDMTSDSQNTQDVNLGPCKKHSFKLSAESLCIKCTPYGLPNGFELLGLGFYYDPIKAIQE